MVEQTNLGTKEVTTVSTPMQSGQIVKTTTKVVPPSVITEHPQKVFEKKKTIFRTNQIIWYIVGVVELLLGFRMTLKSLGADPISIFTSFVYTLSDPLVIPFDGILPPSGSINATFEWSTIIAAIVYLVFAFGIMELIHLLKPVSPDEVEQTV